MRKMKGEKGFTLIGVLVAIAILALVAVIFAGGISTGAKAVFVGDQRATAESLARSQMESIKKSYIDAENHDGSLYADYTDIKITLSGYEIKSVNGSDETVSEIVGVPWDTDEDPPQPAAAENGLQRVILIIGHLDKEAVITLEGYTVQLE